jgi:hypothetical protein
MSRSRRIAATVVVAAVATLGLAGVATAGGSGHDHGHYRPYHSHYRHHDGGLLRFLSHLL